MSARESLKNVEDFTKTGLLGFYTHFECTEIVAFPKRGSPPLNIFTLFVAEEHSDTGLDNRE